MELIIFMAGAFFIFFLKGFYDQKKYRENMIAKLKREWGQVPEEEYTYEELESLKCFYRTVQDNTRDIDDITWNDLDMEKIFMLINNTSSSIGEEYLYAVLRKVKFDEKELIERNRLIEYFQNNSESRLKLQIAFRGMGKMKKISVFEYMNRLDSLEQKSSLSHYLMAGGLLLSILLIFFSPAVGSALTLIMLANNIVRYYKRKGQISAYYQVCTYIIRILFCIQDITKLNIPEIWTYTDQLNKASISFKQFKKGYKIVAAKSPNGDLGDLILDYIRMLFHPDLIKFNSMLKIFKENRTLLNEMFLCLGTLDSMIAVASFRDSLDYYSRPELQKQTKPFIEAEELYHPLIEEPVTNSISEQRCVLITGSNASGKSTFIKALAINAILSQTIYTSMCKKYGASYFQIASSMALKDNIFGKESYYIVEIKSLKRILDRINNEIPTLCFVDEVLRGTNTLERIAASSQILYSLSRVNAICFAATHDVELTHILEKHYSNYHFQEKIINHNVIFDYKLFQGRSITRNAIKLLEIMGYSEDIINRAANEANSFLENGTWRILV
ncbi:MAG: mismatch repair protein MutS domain protein [Lachnospiraceae bacterium]|jgi:DNA mismatch repair ATPase MutS|nr:mismatch repair protein MutS domain protein [Lachnospiraceae bacterium]